MAATVQGGKTKRHGKDSGSASGRRSEGVTLKNATHEPASGRALLIAQTFGDVSAIKELISLHFSGDSLSAKVTSIDGASPNETD